MSRQGNSRWSRTGSWLSRHRPGATGLLWCGSVCLLIADVLAADLVPGPAQVWHTTAAVLALTSVALFALAAAIGVHYLLVLRNRRAWERRRLPGTPYPVDDDVLQREASRGIEALEAFLARQKHTR